MADSEIMVDKPASGEHVGSPGAEKGVTEEGACPRARWANKMEFFLSMSTQIVTLHNMCTFFYIFTDHGGVSSLIPYCLCLFFCGMPLLFLGLALGQYTSESGATAWKKICPMFEGIGIATLVILAYMNVDNILLPVWSLCYLYNSFKNPLPWTTCDNPWNTMFCVSRTNPVNSTDEFGLESWNGRAMNSAEMEFWRSFHPLHYGSKFEDRLGLTLQWNLIPCLLIVLVLTYFCTWKGIKYTGKVMYVVIFPYLLLVIFFIRGVTLPGAVEGLTHLFRPDFHSLENISIWIYSVNQVSYIPTCLGVRSSLGSYNKYNNDCYRDCFILCALHIGTSIFLCCIIAFFAGFVFHVEDLPLDDFIDGGLDLVFCLFPKVLSIPGVSYFWVVLFFLMIFLLTLSHQAVLVESLATKISDLLPRYLRKVVPRELLVLAICGLCLLVGLLNITKASVFLQIIGIFGLSNFTFCFIVCFETIVIAWVYGADRFYDNIADMIGYAPFPVLKYCWMFITPLFCGALAFVLLVIPLMCIPVFMVISLCRGVQNTTTPSADLRQAHPHRPALTLCKRVISAGTPQPELSGRGEAIMM